jgi:hypothetical protein
MHVASQTSNNDAEARILELLESERPSPLLSLNEYEEDRATSKALMSDLVNENLRDELNRMKCCVAVYQEVRCFYCQLNKC